jgi:hypothetical protein
MSKTNCDRGRRNLLAFRDQLSESLYRAIRRGHEGMSNLPGLIIEALEEKVWDERLIAVKSGEHFAGFGSFAEYMRAGPPEGLGTSEDIIYSLLAENPEARDLLDRELQRPRDGAYVVITLRTDDIVGMAGTLRRHLSRDRVLELINLLK